MESRFEKDKRGKDVQLPVDFENDPEYKEIREGLDPAFLESAATGVDLYLAGDWRGAKAALSHALELRPGDGPASHVMGYMKSFDFDPPSDWAGVRELDGY
ncbi:Voltage-gated Ion Channel (VIC) Superfamily [Achlya hypogyna]|uniref:Voltage-gated Ion Channel (VIC) Superfamily n=1 Tax=Achlya hypogyna TaxID=1202772 RepID=A0A1V9YUJ3_ACHHY|nr:Voltage-gated Ion Channel (VIC) Superfamily [Achlya hypogyna]